MLRKGGVRPGGVRTLTEIGGVPATVVDDFEDNNVDEWSLAADTGVGGIQAVQRNFSGTFAGQVFTNSTGSAVVPYINYITIDASSNAAKVAAYLNWDEQGTTLALGFSQDGDEGRFVGVGTGYKAGNDWQITNNIPGVSRDAIATQNSSAVSGGTWYEGEFEIKPDNSVRGTIYNISGLERVSKKVELTATQSAINDLSRIRPATIGVANNFGSNYQMEIDDVRI